MLRCGSCHVSASVATRQYCNSNTEIKLLTFIAVVFATVQALDERIYCRNACQPHYQLQDLLHGDTRHRGNFLCSTDSERECWVSRMCDCAVKRKSKLEKMRRLLDGSVHEDNLCVENTYAYPLEWIKLL